MHFRLEPLLSDGQVEELRLALPVQLHNLSFSRSDIGEGYGRHIDNAYMAGGRSDLSFTLFLSDPDPTAAAIWRWRIRVGNAASGCRPAMPRCTRVACCIGWSR